MDGDMDKPPPPEAKRLYPYPYEINVIQVFEVRLFGDQCDKPWKEIKQYWSFDGKLLAENIIERGDLYVSE